MSVLLQQAAGDCTVCGGLQVLRSWMEVAETHTDTGDRYRYLRCAACDAAVLVPRPPALGTAQFFDRMHEERAEARLRTHLQLLGRGVVRDRRGAVQRAASRPGVLLDVGCGTGEFLAGMASSGWDVYGTEQSPYAAAIARKAVGADRVVVGDIACVPKDQFDVITLWHVLEHAEDPHELLAKVAGRLTPGGTLIVEVPNAGSLALRASGTHYHLHMVPEHLYYWSERSLERIGGHHGLKIDRIEYVPWFHLALSRSLRNVARARWGAVAGWAVMGMSSPWSVMHTYLGTWWKTTEAVRAFFRWGAHP